MPEIKIDAVIKIGGHALDNAEARASFMKQLFELQRMQKNIVLVHGGGPQINDMLKRLGIPVAFHNGLRITSPEILDVAEMILCGQRNKEILRMLIKTGIKSAAISGQDGKTIMATQKDPALGRVGKITKINTDLILSLLAGGFMPLLAPIGLDEKDEPININADTAAAWLAGALKADKLILLSDVPGVLDKNGNLLPELNPEEIQELENNGIIHGGMIPKTEACLAAISNGCRAAEITDGRDDLNLLEMLVNNKVYGTLVHL